MWINVLLCLVSASGRGPASSKVIYHLRKQGGWQLWMLQSFIQREKTGWGWNKHRFSHLIMLKVKGKTEREGDWKKFKTLAVLGLWHFKGTPQTVKHRQVHYRSVVFVTKTGWLFYFIFKIAYLVNFISTNFDGHITSWSPGDSLTVEGFRTNLQRFWLPRNSEHKLMASPGRQALRTRTSSSVPGDLGWLSPSPAVACSQLLCLQGRRWWQVH